MKLFKEYNVHEIIKRFKRAQAPLVKLKSTLKGKTVNLMKKSKTAHRPGYSKVSRSVGIVGEELEVGLSTPNTSTLSRTDKIGEVLEHLLASSSRFRKGVIELLEEELKEYKELRRRRIELDEKLREIDSQIEKLEDMKRRIEGEIEHIDKRLHEVEMYFDSLELLRNRLDSST